MRPEIGGDPFQRHAIGTAVGDPHYIFAEPLEISLGHDGVPGSLSKADQV